LIRIEAESKNERARAVLSLIGHTPLVALRFEREDSIVTLLCDRAERYFSTPLFEMVDSTTV